MDVAFLSNLEYIGIDVAFLSNLEYIGIDVAFLSNLEYIGIDVAFHSNLEYTGIDVAFLSNLEYSGIDVAFLSNLEYIGKQSSVYSLGSTDAPVGKQERPEQCEDGVGGGEAAVHGQVEHHAVSRCHQTRHVGHVDCPGVTD